MNRGPWCCRAATYSRKTSSNLGRRSGGRRQTTGHRRVRAMGQKHGCQDRARPIDQLLGRACHGPNPPSSRDQFSKDLDQLTRHIAAMKPQTLLMAGMLLVIDVGGFVVGASLILALTFGVVGVIVVIRLRHHGDHDKAKQIRPLSLLLSTLGALTVLARNRLLSAPVVMSAATVGAAGTLLEAWGGGVGADASYCGAFAGITSKLVLTDPGWGLLTGAGAGVLFELVQNSWTGIGAKLGSMALLGVLSRCALALIPQITHLLSYRCDLGPVLESSLPSLVAGFLLPPPLETIAPGPLLGQSTPGQGSAVWTVQPWIGALLGWHRRRPWCNGSGVGVRRIGIAPAVCPKPESATGEPLNDHHRLIASAEMQANKQLALAGLRTCVRQ